jgi:transcriptional antiterminator Rof (Rho-off)
MGIAEFDCIHLSNLNVIELKDGEQINKKAINPKANNDPEFYAAEEIIKLVEMQ